MYIKYNTKNAITHLVTWRQILLNPLLAIFNFAIVNVIENDYKIKKLNVLRHGQLFKQRFNIFGNYKMYFNLIKDLEEL
jgi:hypothetical protein